MKYGWRTGAILEEVEVSSLIEMISDLIVVSKDEISILNSDQFQKTIHWVYKGYSCSEIRNLYLFMFSS